MIILSQIWSHPRQGRLGLEFFFSMSRLHLERRVSMNSWADYMPWWGQFCHALDKFLTGEPETKHTLIFHCLIYHEIKGRFYFLFRGFWSLSSFEFTNQQCLTLYLMETTRLRTTPYKFNLSRDKPLISSSPPFSWWSPMLVVPSNHLVSLPLSTPSLWGLTGVTRCVNCPLLVALSGSVGVRLARVLSFGSWFLFCSGTRLGCV